MSIFGNEMSQANGHLPYFFGANFVVKEETWHDK